MNHRKPAFLSPIAWHAAKVTIHNPFMTFYIFLLPEVVPVTQENYLEDNRMCGSFLSAQVQIEGKKS